MIIQFPSDKARKPIDNPHISGSTDKPDKRRQQRLEPRGLSRYEAASYIGIGVSLFDELVNDGRMPKPKRINARTVWDRRKLDEAFDALDDDAQANPWNDVA